MKIFLGFLIVAGMMVFGLGKVKLTPEIKVYPSPAPIVEVNPNLADGYFLERGIGAGNIRLINNTETKSESKDLIDNYDCDSGINGGFYSTDSKPMGWMVINGQTISKAADNDLFDGFILIKDSAFSIVRSADADADFGLQTGPVLILNGQPQKLNLIRDKPARRMIMGLADDGIFIMAIFNGEAETTGPNLTDLPRRVMEIAETENMNIESAINLDGGGASAFYSSGEILTENSPVGSWWCIR